MKVQLAKISAGRKKFLYVFSHITSMVGSLVNMSILKPRGGICEICIARSLWTFFRRSSIFKANNEELKAISAPKRKGPGIKVTPHCKAKIAKYALKHDKSPAERKYTCELKENLNESTVQSG